MTFSVDAYPNDTFEGVVNTNPLGRGQLYKFRQQRHIRYGRHLRSCQIRSNPDLKLKPRLTANVTIYTLDRKNVLSGSRRRAPLHTPKSRLSARMTIVKDKSEAQKLWTREGNTFIAHPVTVGISNGVNTGDCKRHR